MPAQPSCHPGASSSGSGLMAASLDACWFRPEMDEVPSMTFRKKTLLQALL
ncbi:hypothetical protein GbCGDNIH2_5046 [Granulibacter bethesdensis]|uniref:Uncharacterized protein n=1 Tax=Granulibacter bethesdensis (strain ATCC BAA-1260 / CGDNIH1) TaxID=391165 RepID=A0A286M383_GRABC|nr:hypothetical protein GbCGDNIH2_5046 [Granulibacter bethesdensis]APH52877.1 hypothetical protein GbCGDNIH5_5046 [Granulibacter bethesdensis]APH65565.1 hypothetical protein GbCGDNIH1I4_5046 [Granulibacter bethesdensis]ASV62482.1 hypothetical protein GbCGDNIH1_5046 [Granulibacter bethesdensis CGDNIH1]